MALPNTNGVFIHQGYNCSPNLVPTGQSIQVSSTDTTSVSNTVNAFDQNFANQYDSTTTYGLGDWCIYDHSLYRCKVSSAGPEEWDPTHWDAISVNNLIWDNSVLPTATWSSSALNSAFNTVNLNCAPNYDPTSTYEVGDWCIYANILYQCTTAIPTAENWNSSHWTARQLTNQDINSLRDVQIDSSTLTAGQALVYKNGHWENGAGGGGGATSLDDLTDVDLTSPAANETLVCEIVSNEPVFKNKATTWTGTEAEYHQILVKDPNVTYYITDGDGAARYIICTQAQYNAWKTAGTLQSDIPYYITDAENSGVVINDNITTSTEVWSSLKVSNSLEAVKDEFHGTVGADVYDDTSTYAVGDLCIYNNALYKCTTAITTAEAWNASHWTATSIAKEIGRIDTVLNGSDITSNITINSDMSLIRGQAYRIGSLVVINMVLQATASIPNNAWILTNLPKAYGNYRYSKGEADNLYFPTTLTNGGFTIDNNSTGLANFTAITANKYIFVDCSYITNS